MVFEESDIKSADGLRLRRYQWRPEGPVAGGVILVHGLGDYLLRYEHVARFFVERGFACEGVDFPGHGKSSGQRGHVSRWETFTELFDGSRERLRALFPTSSGSLGMFAHSMGGFVTFDYLARRPGDFSFAWLSSPLVRPSHGRASWLVRLSDPLGRLLPRMPYDTGVRVEDCVSGEGAVVEVKNSDALTHHRTTFGFGRRLVRHEQAVWEGAGRLKDPLRLLVTQGTEDEVCPHDLGRELFDRIPLSGKRFASLPGEKHEPLHGDNPGRVFQEAASWMEEWAGEAAH